MSRVPHVLVGLSGGLDSAFTAYLLKKEGYDVDGIHFSNGLDTLSGKRCFPEESKSFSPDKIGTETVADETIAQIDTLSKFLDIEVQYMNTKAQFEALLTAVDIEMCNMQTPNICVMCARDIKFGFVLQYALSHGYNYLATGHYVRIEHNEQNTHIMKGIDETRDQSYGFGVIPLNSLKHVLTPLGNYIKTDIRKIADDIGLPYINKESRGLCFTHEPFNKFYQDYTTHFMTKGKLIVSGHPECSMEHNGQQLYVRGQKATVGKYQYVVNKKLPNGDIIISPRSDVCENIIKIKSLNFIVDFDEINMGLRHQLLIRYNGELVDCVIDVLTINDAIIRTGKPVLAPIPGQIGTIYLGDQVIFGGFIYLD